MVLRVRLPDYAKQLDETFFIFVDDCTITDLRINPPTTTEFTYEVVNPASSLVIPLPEAFVFPAQCAYHGVINTLFYQGSTDLPVFAFKIESGLLIRTAEARFVGIYDFTLIIEPNGPNTVSPIFYDFKLTIGACRVNVVTVENS